MNANNRLEEVEDEYGARVRYGYDCLGNLTWKEEGIQGNGGVKEAITRYVYDWNDRLRKEIHSSEGKEEGEVWASYYYDSRVNRVRTVTGIMGSSCAVRCKRMRGY